MAFLPERATPAVGVTTNWYAGTKMVRWYKNGTLVQPGTGWYGGTPDRPIMKILDVGCGANKYPGAVGLDNNPRTAADVIHDLGDLPYPFPDNEFDLIVASHVIEHVPDVMAFVTELYRIAKPGGRIRIATPHYTNPDWPNDPTHRNHLNSFSFDTFVPGRETFDFYTEVKLKPIRRYVSLTNLWRAFGLQALVNSDERFARMRFFRKFWEHYLNSVVRGKELQFEFEVIKDEAARNGS